MSLGSLSTALPDSSFHGRDYSERRGFGVEADIPRLGRSFAACDHICPAGWFSIVYLFIWGMREIVF